MIKHLLKGNMCADKLLFKNLPLAFTSTAKYNTGRRLLYRTANQAAKQTVLMSVNLVNINEYCTKTGLQDESGTDVNERSVSEQILSCKIENWNKLNKETKISIAKEEYESLKASAHKMIPKIITNEQLEEMIERPTYEKRVKYLHNRALSESYYARIKSDKKSRRSTRQERHDNKSLKIQANQHIYYALFQNSLFLRVRRGAVHKFYNYHQIYALLYEQNIVLDFGFDQFMTKEESKTTAAEVVSMYEINRKCKDPFHFHVCNVKEGFTLNFLQNILKNIGGSNCLLNVTPKSYLEIFPKEKLIYLTPDSKNVLEEYDHEAVYIIGGIVDKMAQPLLTLAKAEREGIKTARLPTCNISWQRHKVVLKIVDMMKVMLTVKSKGEWNKAFRRVCLPILRK